ncbi:MAG: sugar-binding protein, partial [Oscillospiraceae bacterium]|nr:sugar-binding protein [Oscillospiraceae bacterium]
SAIEGNAFTNVLKDAKSKNIVVIAYDRPIMDTDAVSYYATFGNLQVGQAQGQHIIDKLDLENAEGPFNIEFFTGDPGDNNIRFFYPGAFDLLKEFLDDGTLVCLSGQTDIETVATLKWSAKNAQDRMEALISAHGYGPGKTPLAAVMCSNDSTAQGVTQALLDAGFTEDNFPIVTGQDCDAPSVKNMRKGFQSMSVFKDTRILANRVKDMVLDIIAGNTPATNAKYNNNVINEVPSYECELLIGTPENWKEILVDSGYKPLETYDID